MWEAPLPPMPWRPGRGFTPPGRPRDCVAPLRPSLGWLPKLPSWVGPQQRVDRPKQIPVPSVATRTRRRHPCQTCREADRQRTGMLALLWCGLACPEAFRRWPRRIFPTPHAPGARGDFSTEVPGSVLRAGPDVDTKTQAPKGHHERGLGSRAGRHHRVEPHAQAITRGRSGIPWAKKWPRIGILQESRN